MARRQLHSDDAILDAARDLLASGGSRAATTAAISDASGAPVGSLYHRYGSRGQLFAQVWLRTVRRFQDGLLAAAGRGEPVERAVAAAAWTVEFAARHPQDARLLLRAGRDELPDPVRSELATLNQPVADLLHRLATDVFGSSTPDRIELMTVAVVDMPYAFARRHLAAGTPLEPHRAVLERAVRALLHQGTGESTPPAR
ncbi:TetR/AcrR family transcriptional regulator [Pseudonocardia sp. TRM90224]|uniref:TetR/AcrR family transcriptional regulator n=1 Tax=Pseudonocardia sp. TRM90224 TaxID=2812678 RepID=UPI001E36FA46|nr:TetR/AcrR family transcriptional regulator [Pseudonocardia sp. TRM90224]